MEYRFGNLEIMSKKCTGVGIHLTGIKDKGKICKNCLDMRIQKGSTHPISRLNMCNYKFLQGIDRRTKLILTITNCNNSKSFAKVSDELLS